MVIAVGCDIEYGISILYNSVSNAKDKLKLITIGPKDANFIKDFFQEIKRKIPGIIDYFCVFMDFDYSNEFRKKFIEASKNQTNVKTVRILGVKETKLYGAIELLSFSPEADECLLIFDCRDDNILCHSWRYNDQRQWKYIEGRNVIKDFKGHKTPPTAKDLQRLRSKLQEPLKKPYICIFHEYDVNKDDFKRVFTGYKRIEFYNLMPIQLQRNKNWAKWTLNYARHLFNEYGYSKYKSDKIFDRNLVVKTVNEIYFQIFRRQTLPFNKTIQVTMDKAAVLKICDDNAKTETIPVEKGKFSITLDIDINGIYTIAITSMQKTHEIGMLNDIQNEFYFIPKKISDYNTNIQAIGIDLGTTECCVSVIRKNGPDFVVLDNVTGLRTMPSYVAFDEKEPKCGQIVIDRMKHKSEYTVYDSKRIIGRKNDEIVSDHLWPFKLQEIAHKVMLQLETYFGKDIKSPEEISSTLLNHIKRTTEIYEGKALTEAVITIPSVFSAKQKEATLIAAEMAGWETIYFIPEPIAAAFAYFTEIEIPNNSNILICDCGGGTTDICVAKVSNSKVEILSFDGDPYLGGRDFDNLLFIHFRAILKDKYFFDVMESTKKYLLKRNCQDIKHKLSVAEEDWLDVDDFDPTTYEEIKLSKNEFEQMSSTLVIKIKDVILRAIVKANIPKNSIKYVFQVGGGCRMPMIKQLLLDIFPYAKHECNLYPDWVVAHGAALYAYHMKSEISTTVEEQQEKPKSSWLNKIFKQ